MSDSAFVILGSWSYGIATVGFALFALRLVLGWRRGWRSGLLLAVMVVTALWAAFGAALVWRPGNAAWMAGTLADSLRYALWFVFLASLLARDAADPAGGMRYARVILVAALAAAALASSLVVPEGIPFAPSDDPAGRTPAFALRVVLAVAGLILVEQLYRRADGSARWAIKPLCVALVAVFAFDLYYFADAMLFGRLDADVWIARGLANALVIPLVAIATARNPGWTIELHVSRGAVFHSTALLVSGLFLLVIAAAGYIVRYIGGDWGRALQIELLFVALLAGAIVLSSGRFRSRLRVFVSKHFFSYRYDYREEWLRFTRALADATGIAEVQAQAVRGLADLVESPGGALWMRQDDGRLALVRRFNMPAPDESFAADDPLPAFCARQGWIVDLPELAVHPDRYDGLAIPPWLRDHPAAWLVVPLESATELVGLVVLARSRASVEVNWEVRDLLKVASRQAASYLGHARATDALVEARKFDAFNRMSAFVVHDLKNLVAQLSLLLKNAERHRDNPEFQRDMLATIDHVVGRMNRLMLQLRSGATPVENPRPTDLDAVVRAVCASRAQPGITLAIDSAPGIQALGHEDRLERVVGHVVQNAIDAMTGGGAITVRVYRDGASAVVEVRDTGIGMTHEFMRDRLYKPFETSKPTGMGIGVYESMQYVSGLGGRMLFDSEPGVGTRARIVLPAADAVGAAARLGTAA